MTDTNTEYLKRAGFFIAGLIIGIVIVVNNYQTKYLDKTAYEWENKYTDVQSKLDTLTKRDNEIQEARNDLINCLGGIRRYTDYYGGSPYYVSDVSDINQCINDNQQWLQDQSTQDYQQQP